jgi:hypothetical protein
MYGCTAMTTLPNSQLQETASAVTGKQITSVSSVRHVGDMSYFDARAEDGTVYACSLQVVFGTTSQHQKCHKK